MRLAIIKRKCQYSLVWLSDVRRIDPATGLPAGRNVHLWQVETVRQRRVVLNNLSTGHRVELDAYNIKQFDQTAPNMPAGAVGAFVLRSPVIQSGCNAVKSLAEYLEARRTRPQIFLPGAMTFAPPQISNHWVHVATAGWRT